MAQLTFTTLVGKQWAKHPGWSMLQRMIGRALPIIDRAVSSDGSMKLLLSLEDGKSIEAVLIPRNLQPLGLGNLWLARTRRLRILPWRQLVRSADLAGFGRQLLQRPSAAGYAACLSSQVGCAMGCTFCRTAQMQLLRNLSTAEILGQIAALQRLGHIRTLVFMGMGEPLHNFDAVLEACQALLAAGPAGYDRRQIIVSTCGLVPAIYALADALPVRLALSLNATTDRQRAALMPGVKRWPLEEVLRACQHYSAVTATTILIEYVVLAQVNDTRDDARRLAWLLRALDVQIQLVPFNEHPQSSFRRPSEPAVRRFRRELLRRGLPVSVRLPGGRDIDAACGQLHSAAIARQGEREDQGSDASAPDLRRG